MTTDSKDEWSIPCFANDEELEPPAEELEAMYQQIEGGTILELQWKCHERRQPSPVATNEADVQDVPEKEKPIKNKDFDFMDEVATPAMRVRMISSTPKGSAKKKTANFAGVLDAMKKHGRLSQQHAAATGSPNKDTSSNS